MGPEAIAGAAEISSGWRWPWLFARRVDLAILGLPLLGTALAWVIALRGGDPSGTSERAYAGWVSQFVLGNSTHVILTFLLLGLRRDVLRATPTQPRLVIFGSLAAFAVSFAFFWLTQQTFPSFFDFGSAVALTFATHHALAQVKGIWSLYNLRAGASGLRPSAPERSLQQIWVPLGLVLILVKWFFVGKRADNVYPFIQPIPGEPAFLPYATTHILLAAWIGYVALLARELLLQPARNASKLLYLGVHALAVALTITSPGWGATITAGIHGLEYYFLCGRMLGPTPDEPGDRIRGSAVWGVMGLAMFPLMVVGVFNAPFTVWLVGAATAARHQDTFRIAQMVLNGVVISHYFADAFIYRFRIPEIRRVALARMRFA